MPISLKFWLTAARLSGWVYNWDGEPPEGVVLGRYEDPDTDSQAALVMTEDRAFLVFRGTSSLKDALIDIDADFTPLGNGQVHAGGFRAFVALFPQLADDMGKLITQGIAVTAVGHSLGGLLAQIAGFNWQVPVVSFGSPRAGDAAFAAELDVEVKHARITHEADPVPLLPPCSLGYKHSGQHAYIDSEGQIHLNPSLVEEVLERAKGAVDGVLRDHFITNYIVALEAACQKET